MVGPFSWFSWGRGRGGTWVDRSGGGHCWRAGLDGRLFAVTRVPSVLKQLIARLVAAYDRSTRWLTSMGVGEARQTARGRHPRPGERLPPLPEALGPIPMCGLVGPVARSMGFAVFAG